MNDLIRFRLWTVISCVAALVLSIGSGLCLLIAVNANAGAMTDPGSIIAIGADRAPWLRRGLILDVLGYYLLFVPLALYLRAWLRPCSPNLVDLFTLCGLGYVLVGSIGAVILSSVLPPLVVAYAQAGPQQRDLLQLVFNGFMNAVFLGLWNPLEALLFGGWLSGIGALIQPERRWLGIVTRLFGLAGLVAALGRLLEINLLFLPGVFGILLFPFWLPAFVVELRRPFQQPAKRELVV